MNQPSNTAQNKQAKFTTGSTMRHVVVMTATSSVGLFSIFAVDALNLFYIAQLGQQELAAAIGYAATIMFFSMSIGIGIAIATGARVGRTLGSGDPVKAKQIATSCLLFMLILSGGFSLALYPALEWCLHILGARGDALQLAIHFMQIIVPSIPLLAMGMSLSALLRANGDAKRAMYVTLFGGLAALVLDPLFIIYFDLGLTGAALATFCVRIILACVGLWFVQGVHQMLGTLQLKQALHHIKPFLIIAGPAIATQLATPVGNAYVTQTIAEFGDDAVAGWAIVGRLIPLAFGTIFALSGAVGPIVSQNYGAGLFSRITSTLRDSLIFTGSYCLVAWLFLALTSSWIITLFDATGNAASLISTFCFFVAGSFLFNGFLFVANALFNNLGFALYATLFNWGRATLGVIPFVLIGKNYGAEGVLIGWGLGAVVFGVGAIAVAFHLLKSLPERAKTDTDEPINIPPAANSPFSSGKTAGFSGNIE